MEKCLSRVWEALQQAFGGRIFFFGLQGSYARGEATAESDIDLVFILDRLDFADLVCYRGILDAMPEREKLCGFVAGREELFSWERADLLTLFLDTKPIFGSLAELADCFSKEDVRHALLAGACQLYHGAAHNALYGRSRAVLRSLYKAARFSLRIKVYLESGCYYAAMKELEGVTEGEERAILSLAGAFPKTLDDAAFDEASGLLFSWASALIRRYGDKNAEEGL